MRTCSSSCCTHRLSYLCLDALKPCCHSHLSRSRALYHLRTGLECASATHAGRYMPWHVFGMPAPVHAQPAPLLHVWCAFVCYRCYPCDVRGMRTRAVRCGVMACLLQVNDMTVINALWFISTSITPVPCARPPPPETCTFSRLLLLSSLLQLNARTRRLSFDEAGG